MVAASDCASAASLSMVRRVPPNRSSSQLAWPISDTLVRTVLPLPVRVMLGAPITVGYRAACAEATSARACR